MWHEVKFHVDNVGISPLYRSKACSGVLPVELDSIGNMYQGSSFGADVRQVRSSLCSAVLLDINIVT